MGCSVSKLEPGEEVPPGLNPVKRKIEEIKRSRRSIIGRKDSIVSTTELLASHEEAEVISDVGCSEEYSIHPFESLNLKEKENKAKEETRQENVEVKSSVSNVENSKEEKGDSADEEKGRRFIHYDDDEEEELPRSPSFRVYFIDDSDKVEDDPKEECNNNIGETSEKDTFGSKQCSESSSEGSEVRVAVKKVRGRRLRALATKPITYGFRSCYSIQNAVTISQADRDLLSASKASTVVAQ